MSCSFPLTFPFTLGGCGYRPPDELLALEGTELAWIASHCADGKSLLLAQFRGKPRLEAVLCALLRGVQELDDATWQVLTETWLDTAVGVQLETLGDIVDLPRRGWSDEVYRTLLRAQVLVLRSSGTWPELLRVLEVIGVTLTVTRVSEPYPAAAVVALGEPFGVSITSADAFGLLDRARPGGVRFDLEFPMAAAAASFTWADGDVEQAEVARGWPSDDTATDGGLWADVHSTEETS